MKLDKKHLRQRRIECRFNPLDKIRLILLSKYRKSDLLLVDSDLTSVVSGLLPQFFVK